jgi:chemotaxis protein CheD
LAALTTISFRYGPGRAPALSLWRRAVQELLNKLLELGSQKSRLQAKLFGGACVIDAFRGRENHLGTKNIQTAEELLERAGIPLVAHDVGGCKGRKVIFHTDDGTAWVRQL